MFEGNEVSKNVEAGFRVESDACPLIDKENRVHSGRSEGIVILDGHGVVRGNRIYGNKKAGLKIEGGNPLIRKNMMYASEAEGCHVCSDAKPRLERNDLFGNQRCALLVDGGADPLVRKNLVRDGKSDGIVIGPGGLGLYEGNRIFMNANVGFKVCDGGAPMVRDNAINNGNGTGLALLPGAMGDFADNVIAGNYGDQVRVEGNPQGGDNPSLTFKDNRIDFKTQPSFRQPDLAPIIREQGSRAFLEQKEVDVLPEINGAGRKGASAPGLSRFKRAGAKVKVAAAMLGGDHKPKLAGSLSHTVSDSPLLGSRNVKWLTSLDSPDSPIRR